MIEASKLPQRYGIGKSLFKGRRSYLLELGYDLEPEKDGKRRKYSDSQIKLLDELDRYISSNGGIKGFPPANASAQPHPEPKPAQENKNDSTKRPPQRWFSRELFSQERRNLRGHKPDSGH